VVVAFSYDVIFKMPPNTHTQRGLYSDEKQGFNILSQKKTQTKKVIGAIIIIITMVLSSLHLRQGVVERLSCCEIIMCTV